MSKYSEIPPSHKLGTIRKRMEDFLDNGLRIINYGDGGFGFSMGIDVASQNDWQVSWTYNTNSTDDYIIRSG